MIRLFWKSAVATVLLGAAIAAGRGEAAPPTSKKKSTPTETTSKTEASTKGEVIVVKEQGKPDRKCAVVSRTPRADGTVSLQVKAMDNGEVMTIIEPKTTGMVTLPPTKLAAPEAVKATKPSPTTVTKTTEPPKISRPTPVKSETIPSAMNPPSKAKEAVKPIDASATMNMVPVEMPRGTATVSEPVPVGIEPARLPLNRSAAPVPVANPSQVAMVQQAGQLAQLKEMLKDAVQPAHREMAAEGLCATAQGTSREVRQLLLTAVQQDPAATVRATCLRCLAKQNVADDVLQTAMTAAQKDQDARVRNEAKSIEQQMSRR